ncbi:MAG: glycosyltransferase family 4 protein [bacterium]
MKKIGIVSEYFYPHLGGITEHVYFFSRELVRRGYEVVLLTGYEGETIEVPIPEGMRIVHLGKSVPIYMNNSFGKVTLGWNLGKKVRRVLEEEKFDLLHIHSPLFMTLPLLFLKYSQTVTVGTLHTYFDSFGPRSLFRLFQKYIQRYFDKMDGVIGVSEACREALKPYVKGDFTCIPNGVDTEWFAKPKGKIPKFDDDSPKVLFLGRMDPRNGLDGLLEAFPAVVERLPEAKLIVVGDGPMLPQYQEMSGALNGKNVFFEGQVNGNRPEYYASCDVFCYPARIAAFSVTLLEAMAAGKPVVGTDNLGFRQAIQDGQNGLLVPHADSAQLSQALLKVLEDPETARRIGKSGQDWVQGVSWQRVTDRILDFYDQIYRRERGRPFQ